MAPEVLWTRSSTGPEDPTVAERRGTVDPGSNDGKTDDGFSASRLALQNGASGRLRSASSGCLRARLRIGEGRRKDRRRKSVRAPIHRRRPKCVHP